MERLKRRQFFGEILSLNNNKPAGEEADPVAARYVNHELPQGLERPASGLNPYSGTWSRAEVIHLLRRTVFGVTPGDIPSLLAMTPIQAVDFLLNNIPSAPSPPVNNYNTSSYTDPTGVLPGDPWVNAPYGDGTVNGKRENSFKSWWLGQMLNQNLSILEKMVFFWHNHFATEVAGVGDARYSYLHNTLLRSMALGNFKTLVRQITTDPAMLKYLNGYVNTKTAPDENYGRELQELFTIGKGNNPNYTEDDVKAAAHLLTGWRIDSVNIVSWFDATKHDTANKQFSPFYGNTLITGQAGSAGAGETDQLIDMIFSKQEAALFICRKIYRFFVYYLIDATVDANVIQPLAQLFITSNFEIKPVLSALLKSEHFFDPLSRGCYITTPLDHLAGTFKTFGVTIPSSLPVEKTYALWNYVRGYGSALALDLGDPPNVAGYPAFYQEPGYYETWINSSTLPKRMAFTDMMLSSGFSAGTGTTVKIDVLAFTLQYANAGDPDLLAGYFVELLLGLGVSASWHDSLKSILLSGQTNNAYWTDAWLAYVANPTPANINIVKPRLTSLLTEITRLAERQLC